MSTICGPNIIEDGLVMYLDAANTKSYPGTGTTWYDLSGNGAHGALLNGITWNPAGYFTFDGVDDGVDGFNVPQNYVDLYIGMNSSGSSGTGIEMVVGKYNDIDKSFRISSGFFNNGWDVNDWSYGQDSYNFINGVFNPGTTSLLNKWSIVRLVNQNSSFSPPFVYSLSSDFYNRRYKGSIAFVLMYNRILSNNEVLQNYNAHKSRFNL